MESKRFTICFKDGTLFTFSASDYFYGFDTDEREYVCKFFRKDGTLTYLCNATSVKYVLEKPNTVE